MRREKIYEGPPLTHDESVRIWRWERRMLVFYTAAMLAICGSILLMAYHGDQQPVRLGIIAMILALAVVGWVIQFRERCPRCNAQLGRQARVLLPVKCKNCGVPFPRPQDQE
jgi:hypothetical protein